MKKSTFRLYTLLYIISLTLTASGQRDEVVQNRPYTDLRQTHFGIVVGTHMQDLEFDNVGPTVINMPDGSQMPSVVYCDQHNWDFGFNVGVLAEFRLNQYFAFRAAPQLYFGNRNIKFLNYNKLEESGVPHIENQSLRSVYVGADLNLIYAAKRHNNHRPYLMAGLAPLFNLSSKSTDYVKLKTSDVFFEIGMGCDFYLPFFKLRPELKFMLGLGNVLDKKHIETMKDEAMLPYASAISKATSKMIVLSFYFE